MTLSSQLHDLLASVTCDLFHAYGVAAHVTSAEPAPMDEHLCSVLGVTGEEFSGSVLIVVEARVLAASNPTPEVPDAKWLAEVTNQVVGRFKNELVRRGVDVALAIPVVLRATKLLPLMSDGTPVRLEVGGGAMSLWLEYEGNPELRDAVADVPREGEALMFF